MGETRAEYPRWVLLETSRRCEDSDAATAAEALTSNGRRVRVSLGLAPPPALSRLRADIVPHGLPDEDEVVELGTRVVAAHGYSVLVEIPDYYLPSSDYFVYSSGDAPSTPPSLSLLPPCYLTHQFGDGIPKQTRSLFTGTTAVLRRGDAVAVLHLDRLLPQNVQEEGGAPLQANLLLLRSGEHWESEWEIKSVPVLHDEGKHWELYGWRTEAVVPVGDRFLCWVDYHRGVIFSDVWKETTELRHVSLPAGPDRRSHGTVCATDGGGELRFVEVSPRCCCGLLGDTTCARSGHAFNITTWALRMDGMAWDKVGVVGCDEIWSLAGYQGVIPRVRPIYPMLSLDDPDVLCFLVLKDESRDADVDGDLAIRLVEVDTRRMELRSVFRYYTGDGLGYSASSFLPSAVSKYFNVSSSRHTSASQRRRHQQDIPKAPAKQSLEPTLPAAAMASPEEMWATLREIPDLETRDLLRAYDALACDESRHFRFRFLLALPMDMRKDYCLVMAKSSCFNI